MDNPDASHSPDPKDTVFEQIPIEVSICVGKARPLVRDLLSLQEQAVLQLDKSIDDPVDLFVGDRLIARGELQELEGGPPGRLAVRLTEVAQDTKAG